MGLPELLRIELLRQDDTELLRRLLLEPGHSPTQTTLIGESQPKLVTNLGRFRTLLADQELGRLQELLTFILCRVSLTVTLSSSLSTSLK